MIVCRNGSACACVQGLNLLKMWCFFELGCTVVRLLILVFNIYVGLVCSSRICYDSVFGDHFYIPFFHSCVSDFRTTIALGDAFTLVVTRVSYPILYC